MKVLVLNCGSSSIKYNLFEMNERRIIISGVIEKIAEKNSSHTFTNLNQSDAKKTILISVANHRQGLQIIFNHLTDSATLTDLGELFCIGHRVVHGGKYFRQPVLITKDVITKIRELSPLAPLHNPANILGIEQAQQQLESVTQVAVFDTAFHQTLPAHAYHYAIPAQWYEENNVRRYGFHGTSHYYVAKKAAEFLQRPLQSLNLISLHLGNGASITAIKQGESIDTSMGLTPMEGLIMGTRCGDIDPALAFYISHEKKLDIHEVETQLNKHSGLKGICGENDMRKVYTLADNGNEQAQLALQMYSYRIKKYIGAYFAVLGHVDAIIFTGGVGENASRLRESCCSELGFLGITIDKNKNKTVIQSPSDISQAEQPVAVLVIKTDEELEIAMQSVECIENL